MLLLPDTVDDYVGPDNPVRFIDAFVDSLDLAGAGFERAEPKETGRPGYDPSDLLKLYIYGYLNRVRSSRRLEAETHRNLEVIWLLRRLRPNFKTLADFRRENREAFRQVFRDFVKVCRSLELFGRELIAVDGTRIKVVNSRDRNFTGAKLRRARASASSGSMLWLTRDTSRSRTSPGARRRGSRRTCRSHGGFLMRRLENVRGEFSLTALAYNIRRATTLAGIPELIATWGVQTSWNRPPRTCCNASGRMASANRRQPTHGPNPRPLTPQNSTRSYFSHSLELLRTLLTGSGRRFRSHDLRRVGDAGPSHVRGPQEN